MVRFHQRQTARAAIVEMVDLSGGDGARSDRWAICRIADRIFSIPH
jgi:hypothetical protein